MGQRWEHATASPLPPVKAASSRCAYTREMKNPPWAASATKEGNVTHGYSMLPKTSSHLRHRIDVCFTNDMCRLIHVDYARKPLWYKFFRDSRNMPGAQASFVDCWFCGGTHRTGQWMELWLWQNTYLCRGCNASIWKEYLDIHPQGERVSARSLAAYRTFAIAHSCAWRTAGRRWRPTEVFTPSP